MAFGKGKKAAPQDDQDAARVEAAPEAAMAAEATKLVSPLEVAVKALKWITIHDNEKTKESLIAHAEAALKAIAGLK